MMPQPSYNPWGTPIFPDNAAFGTGSPQEDAQRAPNLLDNLLSKIAGAAGRAFMAPGQALQSTTPITTEQMIRPAADIAGSMTLGAGAIPADLNALRMGIKAYHSSPHDFDRFDLSKIGTGEGAQVYGHGLYFAESPAVSGQGGQYWNQFRRRFTGPEAEAADFLKRVDFDRDKAIAAARQWVTDARGHHGAFPAPVAAQAVKHYEDVLRRLESGQPVGPRTYEVNLNADPAHFLDWDKPLGQQPHALKAVENYAKDIKDLGMSDMGRDVLDASQLRGMPGQYFYQIGQKSFGQDALSKDLAQHGIPGIKYLDQGSRAGGQGSSNYVMFDDKLIDILRKYGIAGMTAPPIFAGAMSEQKQ